MQVAWLLVLSLRFNLHSGNPQAVGGGISLVGLEGYWRQAHHRTVGDQRIAASLMAVWGPSEEIRPQDQNSTANRLAVLNQISIP